MHPDFRVRTIVFDIVTTACELDHWKIAPTFHMGTSSRHVSHHGVVKNDLEKLRCCFVAPFLHLFIVMYLTLKN